MKTSTSEELDSRFGPVRSPNQVGRTIVHDHEISNKPLSIAELNPKTAECLRKIMDLGNISWAGGNALINDIVIIWIVDIGGEIRISIEELYNPKLWEEDNIFHVRHRRLKESEELLKLGHPSLLDNAEKQARIGGEIYFEPRTPPPANWFISNRSGRYGYGSVEHLEAVRDTFARQGIVLDLDFVG